MPDRAALVAAVALVFVALGLLKPWPAGPPSDVAPTQAPRPTPAFRMSALPTEPRPVALDATAVAALTIPRDAWGLRLITATGPGDALGQLWIPAVASIHTGWDRFELPSGAAVSTVPAERVVAVGITAPDDETPLAMRAWQLGPGGVARLVTLRDAAATAAGSNRSAATVAASASLSRRLFLPPPDLAVSAASATASVDGIATAPRAEQPTPAKPVRWPGGVYRFDVLVGDELRTLTLVLPPTSPESDLEAAGLDIETVDRAQVDEVLAAADFATPELAWVDGTSILHLASAGPAASVRTDTAAGVADTAVGAAALFDPLSAAGWVRQPDVAALGVVLPRGAVATFGSVIQVVPYHPGAADVATWFSFRPGQPTNGALLWSSDGPFPVGIYHIDVSWISQGTEFAATWTVALTGGTAGGVTADDWWRIAQDAAPYVGR